MANSTAVSRDKVLAMPASSMMRNVAGPTPVAQSGSPPFRSDQASAGWSPNGTTACRRPSPNGDSTRSSSQRCRREEDPQRDLTGNTGPRIAQRGRFQGYAPGCFSAYQSPLHSEVGSSSGPHHGDRSSQMNSPMKRYVTPRNPNPMRINAAKVTAAVIQTPSFVTRFQSFLAR